MREEDDLRAALHTLERLAPDPDLMLTAIRASGPSAPPPRPPRRGGRAVGSPRTWRNGWISPLAAATAMVAVVACSIVVTKAFVWRAGGWRPPRVSTTASPFPTWDGLPAYFLATAENPNSDAPGTVGFDFLLATAGNPASGVPGTAQFDAPIPRALRSHDTVGIIATATGRVAATVRLPGNVVSTAASAGAFFAAVVRRHAATFYEIRLTAGGTRAIATPLPIPPITPPVEAIAASPDGSKLAISAYVSQRGHPSGPQGLIVAATATGAVRKWTPPARDRTVGYIGGMRWLADGKTLAFNWAFSTPASPAALRLLDTAAAGDNLLSGRVVLPLTNHGSLFFGYTISPDGTALAGVALCIAGGCRPGSPGTLDGRRLTVGSVVQFAAATGDASVRYTEPGLPGMTGHQQNSGCSSLLWLSRSATRMLLLCFQHLPATRTRNGVTEAHVLLLTGRHVTQLPWLTAAVNETTAFPGVTAYNFVPAFPRNR